MPHTFFEITGVCISRTKRKKYMQPIDIIILVAAIAVVGGVVVLSLWKKKKGKTGCGCGCNGCASCPSKGDCATVKSAEENK